MNIFKGQIVRIFIINFAVVALAFMGVVKTPMAIAGECPLCYPTKNGDVAQVRKLIDAGADVNAKYDDGSTALMWAASHRHADIAKMLLDAGADVNAKDYAGETALMYVSAGEHATDTAKNVIRRWGLMLMRKTITAKRLRISRENKVMPISLVG